MDNYQGQFPLYCWKNKSLISGQQVCRQFHFFFLIFPKFSIMNIQGSNIFILTVRVRRHKHKVGPLRTLTHSLSAADILICHSKERAGHFVHSYRCTPVLSPSVGPDQEWFFAATRGEKKHVVLNISRFRVSFPYPSTTSIEY